METNFEIKQYKTETGFIKHVKVTKENPRDFKIGDKYYYSWHGMTDVDILDQYSSQKMIDELNGNVEKKDDCIDLTYNFWKFVRKVLD